MGVRVSGCEGEWVCGCVYKCNVTILNTCTNVGGLLINTGPNAFYEYF